MLASTLVVSPAIFYSLLYVYRLRRLLPLSMIIVSYGVLWSFVGLSGIFIRPLFYVLSLFVLLAPFEIYYIYWSGLLPTQDVIGAVVETNPKETREFLGGRFGYLGGLPI